jgi:colanic acid biosynthesis glycosyl transferase WcaI
VRTFLLVSQVFPPDPAAVGQYMADVAEHLAGRGHRVLVLTADRGYDDPTRRLRWYDARGGVRVLRLPLTSFGKKSLAARVLGGLSLTAQASVIGLLWPGLTDVLLSTAPPAGALVGLVLRGLRGCVFDYWLMDLNPDEAIAFGHVDAQGISARGLDMLNRAVLRQARHVIALDQVMADRFAAKARPGRSVRVLPPWPIKHALPISMSGPSRGNSFRRMHGLEQARVVMYSGNHSPVHPLDTLFSAIRRFDSRSALRFVFVGSGAAKQPIDDWIAASAPGHVLSLPYQPLEGLDERLSAADVHVTVVGPHTVGIVHPSKLYGALAAGRPVVVIGPKASPAAELVLAEGVGWQVEHGQVDALEELLRQLEAMPAERLAALGAKARCLATGPLSRSILLRRFCDWLEDGRDQGQALSAVSGKRPHRSER